PERIAQGRDLGAVRRSFAGQIGEEARRAGRRHREAEGEARDPRRRGGRERMPLLLRGEGRLGRFAEVGDALRRPGALQVLRLGPGSAVQGLSSPVTWQLTGEVWGGCGDRRQSDLRYSTRSDFWPAVRPSVSAVS